METKVQQLKLKSMYVSEDPCSEEKTISLQCLEDSNYDKDKCMSQFENYRLCKKFWMGVSQTRATKGIEPALPDYEERKKIKLQYMNERSI